jgi:hypothetical protein
VQAQIGALRRLAGPDLEPGEAADESIHRDRDGDPRARCEVALEAPESRLVAFRTRVWMRLPGQPLPLPKHFTTTRAPAGALTRNRVTSAPPAFSRPAIATVASRNRSDASGRATTRT